ncbi:keratin, type I cytoskeletal 18 isoform X2 [Nematolebias whitei]|uniref:keratin, type I cytoskeletal 18 isoform X2 n=1 Tax=Nematolebias whitei TaxID=451745 RepID=UPI001896B5FF|nr:keratin, type I cytoskeletal 18 isoform X2 [Nematolebias whitei]
MPLNSSATVYGGAGGRGARASVSSLEGLRSILRNDPDPAPAPQKPAPGPQDEPRSEAEPGDQKLLRGLNTRLSSFLQKVQQLQEDNGALQQDIEHVLSKRRSPEGRRWEELQEPLKEKEKQVKELTLDNARQLLQMDNTRLAKDDFKNKLDEETRARKEMEKDLDKLKNVIDEIKLEKDRVQMETQLVKNELQQLQEEHQKEVDELLQKIKESEVKVEMDTSSSNLGDIINSIRAHYQKLSEKNLQETEDWYKNKFENMEVEEAQNNEALDSGNSELKELQKQKKMLEVEIRNQWRTINTLEDTLSRTNWESNQRLGPLYRAITKLEANLRDVRVQLENQKELNEELLTVKMKLEKEIETYRKLIGAITAEEESSAER